MGIPHETFSTFRAVSVERFVKQEGLFLCIADTKCYKGMGHELKVVKCTGTRCYTGTDGELKKRGV